MRELMLDVTPFEEKISLHRYLKETFGFPFYYGGNLDALYDELTSTTEPTAVTLRYNDHPLGKMVTYLPKLLSVFEDAARENYNLTLTLVDESKDA